MSRVSRWTEFVPLLAMLLLLCTGLGLAGYSDHFQTERRLRSMTAQAQILAATATAALDFHDQQAAQEYADALRANPQIISVGLYDLSGHLFAGYTRPDSLALPALLTAPLPEHAPGGLLNAVVPVQQDSMRLGFVLLREEAEPLYARFQRDAPLALLLAMAVLLVAVQSAAQAALRRANGALAARAAELAAANKALQEEIAQREEMEDALRQAQKMEAIGQLTGGVAHDFNNLLQVILGCLELLRGRPGHGGERLDADQDRLTAAAQQAGQRAAALTQRLLAYARQQPLTPKPVRINRLVAGMSDLLSRTLGEAIQIEAVLAGGLWSALVDENQLESALINLAVNARDAMAEGGKLTIETANTYLDEAYARLEPDVRPGQYVLLAISDTGSGMPPDVVAKVFEPFFTTKSIGKGTGLGLSQVYGFIKQSGGHTKIYSEPGRGTTVKLYLPRLPAAQSGNVPHAAKISMPLGDPRTCILVVEDEDGVRALTVETLRDLGYTVLEVVDGPAALAVLADGAPVQLLFTDVGLPNGMNGRQLADKARQLRPGLKVLFTTGYARNAIVHDGRLDPGVELIGKPFSAHELGLRIRSLLSGGE